MTIAKTIKFLESDSDVDAQPAAFKQLNESVTDGDLPTLLASLESTSSFWVRELLAEPITFGRQGTATTDEGLA